MPATSHMYVLLHYYCSLHVDLILLHIKSNNNNINNKIQLLFAKLSSYSCQKKKYAPQMPYICHIYQLLNVHIYDNYVSIYASYELSAINNMTWSTGLNFTLPPCAPEHICLQHLTYMSHCSFTVVYIDPRLLYTSIKNE